MISREGEYRRYKGRDVKSYTLSVLLEITS